MAGSPAAPQGCGSHGAGEEGGWRFAPQRSYQHPGQSKHHVFGPGGEQDMAPVTGDVPRLATFFQSSQTVAVTGALVYFQIQPVRFFCFTFPGVLPG